MTPIRKPGLHFIDDAGVQVGVDRHLLAGHGVESETRRDFSGSHRAVADHDVLDGDESQEQDETDNIVAAHDELSEGLDHAPCCRSAFGAVQKNSPAAGQVEREAEQSHQQEQTGEDRKLRGTKNLDRGQKHEHRRRHAEGEHDVEQEARHWHQHYENHADGRRGNDPVNLGLRQFRFGDGCH